MSKYDEKRMKEIQTRLVKHIQQNLKEDEDYVLLATMLLKHSIVLYRTFLTDEQIVKMLARAGETINDAAHDIDKFIDTDETGNPPTVH